MFLWIKYWNNHIFDMLSKLICYLLVKLASPVSFYFLKVTSRKNEITSVAHICGSN